MNHNVIVIHGAYGEPNENWFPYLKQEFENIGIEVTIPKFPTPEGQSLSSWREAFMPYKDKITPQTIFVGHSLGPAFIFDILQDLTITVSASFLVVPFTGLLGNPDFDTINYSLTDREFDWNRIRRNCNFFKVYHSDNDPYVPASKCIEVAKNLDAKIKCVKGAGHFNKSAGYIKFEKLFNDIKKRI